MFDIGPGELLALAVIALLVIGPDKLPRYAAEAARFLRQLRQVVNNARTEVQREIGPEMDSLSLAELNPHNLVRKHLLDPSEDLDLGREDAPARPRTPPNGAGRDPSGAPPPYDADAT